MADDQEHGGKKKNNSLPIHGNQDSMNLNQLILTNIQSSVYFKVTLFQLKTYHEVIDEIYYQVKHLEPWERGSRKTQGNSGMCGSVRGVGSGGIVSSAFCLLYKLYTLKLTRKQLNGLIQHTDSPYIRALGFMYIRFTQPPADLFDWYEEFLQDEEEIDVKAGGGHVLTMGQLCRQFLVKLDWFSTLFPRIPVPIQKSIEQRLNEYDRQNGIVAQPIVPIQQQQQQQHQHQQQQHQQERRDRYEREERPPKEYQRNERRRSRTPPERRYRNDNDDDVKHSSHSRERYSSSKSSGKYYSKERSRSRSRERRDKDRRRYDYEEARNSRRY